MLRVSPTVHWLPLLLILLLLLLSQHERLLVSAFSKTDKDDSGTPSKSDKPPQAATEAAATTTPQEEKRVAIVTLLTTSAYLPGAMVLGESLQRVKARGHRLLLWVPPEEDSRSDLTESQIRELQEGGYWDETRQLSQANNTFTSCRISEQQQAYIDQNPKLAGLNRYWGTCCKFAIWTLTEFDVVVYMDADSFALQNFDFVVDYLGENAAFAAHGVPECWDEPPQCDNFYTAFMVLKPLPNVQKYFHQLASQQYLAEGEITLLNQVIKQWEPLPRFTLVAQTEVVRPLDSVGKTDWTQAYVYDFAGAPSSKPWISYAVSKQTGDPYRHGYLGSLPPPSEGYYRYIVPQQRWNEYYNAVLEKQKQLKAEKDEL